MKIILEDENGRYEIETKDNYATLREYIDYLIIPVLAAAGFAEKNIEECFNEEDL